MSKLGPSGKPNSRRYTPEEKAQAVRLVHALRAELGTRHQPEQLGVPPDESRLGTEGGDGLAAGNHVGEEAIHG